MKKLALLIVLIACAQVAPSQSAISVEKYGAGKPIIFLPGFTSPGSVWKESVDNLDGNFEAHMVSYAGFNGLAPIGTPWYQPIKQQLVDYIKDQNLQELTIIGHSMGGNLAVELAAELSSQVQGLILIESIPCMRELMMPGVPACSLQYDSPYNNNMLAMEDEAFKQMAMGMSQGMTNRAEKIELLTRWTLEADRETYVYGYTDLLKLDLRPELAKIQTETLILGATFPDKEMVRLNYEKQYANLKSKKIVLADDSKHFIMFDQPRWMMDQINNYLSVNVQ
ncbi:MAG: alpha/beta hydrolase [Cyclobacteriaceae bacterium]